ncbi:MAG: hypothetical protein AVDCRST_MAG93-9160 [uncultured Chloroflexia bacterium]|uniref:Uncharacterized protein n=1 Tax=uncultured Chloroflexia bacterium TaxID=1672391 RepID=A0A6J4N8A7_9CHLR|nr:MAG: hypothetical protein AVDCRST_MAG93-9160 [uncultured Chloroflexia bacterium]
MRRSRVVCCIVLTIVALLAPARASAGVTWCRADPVVSLNGTLVDVWVEIPLEYVHLVNGPVTYDIHTHSSVRRALILNDLGFNVRGSRVRFADHEDLIVEDRQFETTFSVHVPVNTSRLAPGEKIPARLSILVVLGDQVLELGTAMGTTESVKTTVWITDH